MGNDLLEKEIKNLRKEVSELKFALNRFAERSCKEIIKMQNQGFMALISEHLEEDMAEDLTGSLLKDCRLFDKCRGNFLKRLKGFSSQCKTMGVEAALANKSREIMNLKESIGSPDKCETCFNGVFSTLNKQARAISSIGIYDIKATRREGLVAELPVEDACRILKATSNPIRLLILKSLYLESKSFTSLSSITGLRSGNLLFHIKMLLKAGLIIQTQERGDYMITKNGSRIMDSLLRVFRVSG
jgi:DNA-binding transcriptional ArsR family regulator